MSKIISEYSDPEDKDLIIDTILEDTLAGFWDWDIENNEEYLSPQFKKMLGYEPDEMENSPDSWQKLIHPEDLIAVLKQFEEHVNSKGAIPYHNEVRYCHKSGKTIHILCKGKVVKWDGDKPLRMIGTHVDITELKTAKSLARTKNDFIGILSHEIKTPLNSIFGFTQYFTGILQVYNRGVKYV